MCTPFPDVLYTTGVVYVDCWLVANNEHEPAQTDMVLSRLGPREKREDKWRNPGVGLVTTPVS